MDRQRLVLGILLVSIFILTGTVSAQDDLVANSPRTDEYLSSGSTNDYVSNLEAGHWTVVTYLDSWYDLEVKITISWDISGLNIIAVSGSGTGNYPSVDFTLNSSSTVYITVSENSIYHDTSGYYDIGIYDDNHVSGIYPSIAANVPRTDEYLYSGSTNYYVSELEAGHWTVVVYLESSDDLEVKITVSSDILGLNIIGVSGSGTGNYPSVDFTLNSNSSVYIAVSENSVYHDTSDYYEIGVYDDSHVSGIYPAIAANVPRTDEYLYSESTNYYVSNLEAGHWTIVTNYDSWYDLEVKITVSLDISGSDIIAVSGSGTGNYPGVDFTLNSSSTVYIAVSENSVYHDTSGYYEIGIYDDSHVPGLLASINPDDWIIIIILAIIFIPICVGGIIGRRSESKGRESYETIAVEAPIHVIPDEYKESVRYDGSETTTVRLPLKCPSCGAEVSFEGIDWVGPLEAKCGFCGGTMRATFERV